MSQPQSAPLLPANFWLPGRSSSPVTDEEIAAVETDYGIRLPPLMIEIWKTNPGYGKPRNRFIVWREDEQVDEHFRGNIGIEFRDSVETCRKGTSIIYDSFCDEGAITRDPSPKLGWKGRPVRFTGLFAIAVDTYGDDFVCLDYRKSGKDGPPGVTLSHFYCLSQPVSDSLEAFIARLQRQADEDCYCLEWSGERKALWKLIYDGFGLEPHPKGSSDITAYHPDWRWKNDSDSKVAFSVTANNDDDEPFIEEPPERWILRTSPVARIRPFVKQRLDELGLKWKVVFQDPDSPF